MEFINTEKVYEFLKEIYTGCLDEPEEYEDLIEEYAWLNAVSIADDMRKYVHRRDTRMDGNFCNIRQDWEVTKDFIASEIEPWGLFDDVIKSIDNDTISAEDLEKFHTWCFDWFLTAFGVYNLKYNFQSFASELEYEKERELQVV